jgi:hypothetical protein
VWIRAAFSVALRQLRGWGVWQTVGILPCVKLTTDRLSSAPASPFEYKCWTSRAFYAPLHMHLIINCILRASRMLQEAACLCEFLGAC